YAACKKSENPEAHKILNEASTRITSMAAAQQVLYATTDATRFRADEFLGSVCRAAQQTFAPKHNIIVENASGELANDLAMAPALILNERLKNAVKHGCNGHGEAAVRVGLTVENGSSVLYVEDDGPGFNPETALKRSSGLQLVQLLARQLRGEFVV